MVLRRTVPKTASWFLTFSEKPAGLISSWPTLGTNASPSHHDFGSMGLCLTPNLKKAFSLPHLSKLFHFTLYQITYISCSYQFITCSFKCSPDIPLENSSLNGGIFFIHIPWESEVEWMFSFLIVSFRTLPISFLSKPSVCFKHMTSILYILWTFICKTISYTFSFCRDFSNWFQLVIFLCVLKIKKTYR